MTPIDVVEFIHAKPVEIAHMLGFNKLTELHEPWIRSMVFGSKEETLQAHRGSYKTTCLSIAMALICILMPSKRIAFFRKTDNDVAEVLKVVAGALQSDTIAALVKQLYGCNLTLTKSTLNEVNTSLSRGVSGASQIIGMGISGSATGKHADFVFTDDIITVRDRASAAERAKTDLFYQELHNVCNSGGRIYNTGTPWHKDDTFRLMPEAKKYDCYSTDLMTAEDREAKRKSMTSSLFAANYELKHIADEDAIFKSAEFTSKITPITNGIAHIDASYGGGDGTALTIINKHGKEYVAYIRLWQKAVDEVLDEILTLCQKLSTGTIYCEKNADKGYLAKAIRAKGRPAQTYHESENKFIKITTFLKGAWSNLKILDCPEYPLDSDALAQVLDYTEHAEHDDMPDSLASAVRIFENKPKFVGYTEGI